MAPDKIVILNGKNMYHGRGVKESIDKSSADSIVCFDEAITDGSDAVTYKLTIDRLVFESRAVYERLRDTLKDMISNPGTITTREVVRYKNKAPYVIVKNYYGCILDARDYEMKPEEKSAQSLSFICADMDEYTEDYQG